MISSLGKKTMIQAGLLMKDNSMSSSRCYQMEVRVLKSLTVQPKGGHLVAPLYFFILKFKKRLCIYLICLYMDEVSTYLLFIPRSTVKANPLPHIFEEYGKQ